MTVAMGTEVYNVDHSRVIARGRSHSSAQRDAALDAEVRSLVEDDAGRKVAATLTSSLNLTGFQSERLDAVLNDASTPKNWEVGEAYSEAYLTAHKKCNFPWSDRWDQRKDKSSLPGADLVGLQDTGAKQLPYRFAFGEVKTSKQAQCPPGVMYGRKGLKRQLDDLRDCQTIRQTLVRYLMVRAVDSDWEDKFQSAMKRFLTASTDVAIFGILVRDVAPDKKDLKKLARFASAKQPAKMHIEVLAIYLPAGSIDNLASVFAPAGTKKKVTKKVRAKKKHTKKGGK